MNILELNSYNLADAVKFNDQLNPKLWQGQTMLPEVRTRLLAIAEDFKEFLGLTDINLKDITLSGSNANYSYTPYSDIDLHLVVDLPEADRNEVYRELFDAKKYQYNDQHNFKIGGYDVELYVENANTPPVSKGVYSVLHNDWINIPRRIRSTVDDDAVRSKYQDLKNRISDAVKSGNSDTITGLVSKIKRMRQTGLEAQGELGAENLAYKMLRSQGFIQQLYDARNVAKDLQLSLQERKKPSSVFTYGFRHEQADSEAAVTQVADPDNTDEDILKDFIDFCVKELKIDHMPMIKLRRDPQWPVVNRTFGRYIDDKKMLEVAFGQRHIMDVLRTVAHELTHKHQHERDGESMGPDAGETGSPYENEANARAGILMRDYARLHPDYFAAGQAEELDGDELKEFAPTADRDDSGEEPDILRQYAAKWYNGDADPRVEKLLATMGWEIGQNEDEAGGAFVVRSGDTNGNSYISWTDEELSALNESASGYIPTKKQAKDPRYVMALTKDVRPGAVGREANKLKLKTDSQGQPQIARPNGLFEQLQLELEQFKKKGTIAESEEQLDEVRMAASNLKQFAASDEAAGIQCGFEAELIFRDTTSDEDDGGGDMEPDYDADERCRSLSQIVEFFEGGEYGYLSPRSRNALEEKLDEMYYEWRDEQMYRDWQDNQDEPIRDIWLEERPMDERIHAALVEGMELTDKEADAVEAVGDLAAKGLKGSEMSEEQLDLFMKFKEARSIAEDILDEDVETSIANQDKFYDSALDNFRDDFEISDDSGFFDDVDLRYMTDVANQFDLDWPYMMNGPGNGGERSWSSIGDSLQDIVGMPVTVSSGYHQARRTPGTWIVEPDSSLDPDDGEDYGLEIVSPPMPLAQALEQLEAVTNWANDPSEGNAYTNSSTGLHMGVSVPYKGGDVDYLKLVLFLGDEYVLQQFGRESNTYTRAAMKELRQKAGSEHNAQAVMELLKNNLLELAERELVKSTGSSKYTSAHKQGKYIEFRSAGGDWLAEGDAEPGKLENTMMRYAYAMYLAGRPDLERKEYYKKLYKLVTENVGDDPVMNLFSQYASGAIDKEQLKKRWAEKTLSKENPQSNKKSNWSMYDNVSNQPIRGFEFNNYTEDEAWAKAAEKLNMSVEILKRGNKMVDKKADQTGAEEPEKELSPRAKLAKQIIQKPKEAPSVFATQAGGRQNWTISNRDTGAVLYQINNMSRPEAIEYAVKYLRDQGLDTSDHQVRPVEPAGEQEPAVAQNFDQSTAL